MTRWYLGATLTGEDLQAVLESDGITGHTFHENGVELRYGMAFPVGLSIEHDDAHLPPNWLEKLSQDLSLAAGNAIAKVVAGGPGDGHFQVWSINGSSPSRWTDEELGRHLKGVEARLTIRAREAKVDEMAAGIAERLKTDWQYVTVVGASDYDRIRDLRKAGRKAGRLIGHKVRTSEMEVEGGQARVAVYVEDIPEDAMAELDARAVEASSLDD